VVNISIIGGIVGLSIIIGEFTVRVGKAWAKAIVGATVIMDSAITYASVFKATKG
jgi:hypothetical protein